MSATVGLSSIETPVTCNGTTVIVETTQNTGESRGDFLARHWAAVQAKEDECP